MVAFTFDFEPFISAVSAAVPSAEQMRPRTVTIACVLAAVFAQAVRAADNTHFDNHSQKWTILATTSYPGGNSKFIKRSIPPGGSGKTHERGAHR